jgi:hypothetical protein
VKLQDGTYVVHVITSGGERHVHVSKDFKVIGADQGGPGAGGPPPGVPPQGGAPQGTPPRGSAPHGTAPQGSTTN